MHLPTAYFSSKKPRDVDVSLESYVDADFANCIDIRHSISGYAFLMAGDLISWQSRSQATHCSPEYYRGRVYGGSYSYTGSIFWLRFLLEE